MTTTTTTTATTTRMTTSMMNVPWSSKHKKVTNHGIGVPYNLSNSFAQPLTMDELLQLTKDRGNDNDQELLDLYYNHPLTYTPNGGSYDLRKDIAELYYGPNTTADDIVVFAGGQVAIQSAAFAICGNADPTNTHAIVCTPSYQSLQEGPKAAGVTSITYLQLSPSNGWLLNVEEVERAIDPTKQLNYIVINEPYNPAGTLMSHDTQRQLVELVQRYNNNTSTSGAASTSTKVMILCDEVYRLLEHDPSTRLPALCDVCPTYGISVVTMSKPWGACGVTIGWIACQNNTQLMKRDIPNIQYFGTACPSRASELQARMILRANDTILHKNMNIIRSNLVRWKQFMSTNDDLFTWIPPTAGAIASIKFKGPLTSNELGTLLLKEVGISIKPSYCFMDETAVEGGGIPPELDYFRVGYGEKTIPAAIDKFQEFVNDHRDEWLATMKTMKKETSSLTKTTTTSMNTNEES